MEETNYSYRLTFLTNPRYIIFFAIVFLFFSTNLFFYHSTENFIFIIIAVILLFVFCYSVFKIQGLRYQRLILNPNSIEYQKNKFEKDEIFYRNIKYVGYFKKNLLNNNNFTFFDGLYIYDQLNDKYIFIGTSFKNYKSIFYKIKEKCEKNNIYWHNIKREKKSLVEELKKL